MISQPIQESSDPNVERMHRARPAPANMAGGHHVLIKNHVENRAGESEGAARATDERMNEDGNEC